MRHYIRTGEYEAEASWWYKLGKASLSIYMLAGRWISFGVHLSIVPLYIDLHILWFIVSLMSTERAKELFDAEDGYLADIEELAVPQ